ncbi:MAG TPA: PilX N-terminal domain-containing pilus assembly protein [Gammaproteobacteria bacterium]|nr:PilX N-terminal domain-containing pilus assembly protein [Gammaproteobacteria bacterium]
MLVVSLLILLVLTIIGVTAMSTTNLEEKMAGNMRTKNLTFQAAESGLRAGENRFSAGGTWATTIPGVGGAGVNRIWAKDAPGDFTNLATHGPPWWASHAISVAGNYGTPNPDPRYLLELYHFSPDSLNPEDTAKRRGVFHFEVTAYGDLSHSDSVLQSVYAKRYQ